MEQCIYYKKHNDLRFDKQEHIIPAGLGGKHMLDKGVVSDEANETFSRTELHVMRNSILGLNRMNNGPGKRGSLNLKRIRNPIMRVIRPDFQHEQIESVLGFIFMGQSIIIPQLNAYMEEDSISYNYLSTDMNVSSVSHLQNDLNEKFIHFLEKPDENAKMVHVPFKTEKHFVHIGFYKKSWYIGSSIPNFNLEIFSSILLPRLYEMKERENQHKLESQKEPQYIEEAVFKFEDELDMNVSNFYFLYVKTAFNALAFFKGSKYVLNDIFDNVRESILTLNNISEFTRLFMAF